jgi:hypothetical protein
MKQCLIFAALVMSYFQVTGQGVVTGRIINDLTGESLTGASVYMKDSQTGCTSGLEGDFRLSVPAGETTLLIEFIGFETKMIQVMVKDQGATRLGDIRLRETCLDLKGVDIVSAYARERKTPVAISTIPARLIETELGTQEFPEIMKLVPGVYSTKEGGGTGDAALSVRGFKQENVALLLNGVPVSSMEHGLVYWSNWLVLHEVTRSIQVQKGLGASRMAINSVGGTVNIITRSTETQKGGALTFSLSDYGNMKTSLELNTGRLGNGFAVSFAGSRINGPGYVDATYVDGWTYFLSVSKEIGPDHKLVLTGLGSPQVHGQNTYKLSYSEFGQYGNKFNYGWGSYNGEINNQTENFFHKPTISLNHYWNISNRSFLVTSVYSVFGNGGGKWTESYYSPSVFSYRNPSNQIDWDAIYRLNATHTDSTQLSNGEYVTGYSKNIQSNFLAPHYWFGVFSNWNFKPNDNWTVLSGIHARTFQSHLFEKVTDLMGGQFWVEDYAWAIDGVANRQEIMHTGDVIKVDNYSRINYLSGFGQVEYSRGPLSAFTAATFSGSWYQREDHYNYVQDPRSEWVSLPGFDVKAGLNYNLTGHHYAFVNLGYFSRQPFYSVVFVNYSNTVATDIKNEKVSAFEAGYGYTSAAVNLRLNGYYTYWTDKSLLSNENILLIDSTMTKSMINGLNALHMGLEMEFEARITEYLNFGATLSIGDWKWKNDVVAEIYDDYDVLVDTTEVYVNGLFVGGAPQTQLGLYANVDVTKDISLKANWVFYDRLYADFNPVSRNNPDDRQQPFMIPSYNVLDLHAIYDFELFKQSASFQVSCFNVTGKENVISGDDGAAHDRDSFRGFWSFGRTFNFLMKISF